MQRRGHADVELPQELVLAIQRVLELNPEQSGDPLDDLSNNFNPVDILNQLFPDGVYFCASRICFVTRVVAEASLARLDAVQAKLAQDERELQAEIDALEEALKRDQDPGRMQLIQEMISVWIAFLRICIGCSKLPIGSPRANVAHTRESVGIRSRSAEYHKGYTSSGSRKKKSYSEHDDVETATNAW